MNQTVGQLLEAALAAVEDGSANPEQKLLAACYWVGQESIRASITRSLQGAMLEYKHGRYHNLESKALKTLLHASPLVGGQGEDETEMRNWDGYEE